MHLTLFLGTLSLFFLCQCQAAPTTPPSDPSTTYVSAFKQALNSEEDAETEVSTTEEPRIEQNDELESSGQENSSLVSENKSEANTTKSIESKLVETLSIIEGSREESGSGDKSSSSESIEIVSDGLIQHDKVLKEEGSGEKDKSSSSEEKSGSGNENLDEEGSGQDKSLSSEENTKIGTNGEKLTLKNFAKDLLHKIAADDKLILQEQTDNTNNKNTDSDDDDSNYDDSDDDGDDSDYDSDSDDSDSDENEKSQSDKPTIEKSISADAPILLTKVEKNKKVSNN